MEIKISYSRMSSYLSCPKKHYLTYVERIEPKKPARPLKFGHSLHTLLQYRGDPGEIKKIKRDIAKEYDKMSNKHQEVLGEDYVQALYNIFDDYSRYYKDARLPTKAEVEFDIEIGKIKGNQVIFTGKIDELYKLRDKDTRKKFIKLGEHKTFSKAPDMNTLVMNTQIYLYAKAVHILEGVLPSKVIWDYIKSQQAKYPVWLKTSERFSLANNRDITPYSYERACRDYKVTDKKILAGAKQFEPNLANFFFKCELDIIPGMVDGVWDSFLFACRQIALHGEKNDIKNITYNCGWCSYRDICYTEFTGGDVEYLKAKNYKERKKQNG